eukprot:scaffold31954_cov66-Phaeocystis_antarctica.AAC.9
MLPNSPSATRRPSTTIRIVAYGTSAGPQDTSPSREIAWAAVTHKPHSAMPYIFRTALDCTPSSIRRRSTTLVSVSSPPKIAQRTWLQLAAWPFSPSFRSRSAKAKLGAQVK